MNTLLISDIKRKGESIIPYALNFSKLVNNRVRVLHTVDPQKQPAVCSSIADSQTFEVGEKLSHKQIIEREISDTKTELDAMLSSEASRLNYPLRVSTSVTENTIEARLRPELEKGDVKLVIFSAVPDGAVIDSLNEILHLISSFDIFSLVVPPGKKYNKPAKAFVLYDFNIEKNQHIFSLLIFLAKFELAVNVASVAKKGDYAEMVMKSELWKQVAQNHHRSKLRITTNILEGENSDETLLNYINRNRFDLVIIPKSKAESNKTELFSKKLLNHMINNLNIPILIF